MVVGLTAIDEGSVLLRFSSPQPNLVVPAWHQVTDAVVNGTFRDLPVSSVKSLREIALFVQRRNCDAELRVRTDQPRVLATITPRTTIDPIPLISGTTVLYGRIVRVGGAKPKIRVQTPQGQVISCDVTETLAKEVGSRLYSWVGLKGTAEWRSDTHRIETFRVDSIQAYQETPIADAFADLAEQFGDLFSDIDDVDEYVSTLRDNTLEV